MIHSLFKIILITSLLTACVSSVDQTIVLSENFKENSKLIVLKTPKWRIQDSVYNQKLSEYFVDNSKTSWIESDKTMVDKNIDTSYINYFLFDSDLSFITEEFEVEDTQKFSFELKKNKSVITTNKCEIFSQSSVKQTVTSEILNSKNTSNDNFSHRLKTFLVCVINHNNTRWELTLLSDAKKTIEAQLKSENLYYEIKGLSKVISLVNNVGIVERKNSPPWLSLRSGLEFFQYKEQVAALSFVGQPKIWLKDNLSSDSTALLLSVNYSLTMFNWLDPSWR